MTLFRPIPALLGLALGLAASPATAAFPYPWSPPYRCLAEARGLATLENTLERRLGPYSFYTWHPEEATCRDILLARDAHEIALCHSDGHSVNLLPPGIPEAFFEAFAAEGWNHDPRTPDGFQSWTPPSRSFTNYYATVGGRTFASESADALRDALPELPFFPETLPADGVEVEQYTGKALSIAAASVYETTLGPAVAENIATLTVGFDVDPDRDGALVHAVLAPVPGSELDAWIRALPANATIPKAAASLEFCNPLATIHLAPLPPMPPFLREVLPPGLAERLANRAFSFALLPPTVNNRTASALFYASTPDPVRPFQTLDEWYGGLYTNRVHGPAVLFAPVLRTCTAWSGPRDFVRDFLSFRISAWRFAPLPDGILAGRNAPDDALDAALDFLHPPRLRKQPWPFTRWPASASRSVRIPAPLALLHADLRPILNAYPAVGPILCPLLARRTWDATNDGAPLPLDAILYLQDGNLHLRLRCPPPKYVPVTSLTCAALRTHEFRKGTRLAGPPSDPHATSPAPGRVAPPPPPSLTTDPYQLTPITPTPFLGYPEAYALHNSRIHAVVVPAISRLAFLSFAPDAPNLLHLDPALAEAGALPPDPASDTNFFNIGGDWTWPVAQTRWPAMVPFGTDWPPPAALADAPCDASAWREPDGSQHVRLVRRYPAPVCATLTREFIVFPHDSPVLRCEQTLSYGPGPIEEIPVPLTLWHVTQVANPFRLGCAIPSADVSPDVLLGVLDPAAHHVNSFKTSNPSHTFIYEPPAGAREVKLAFPPSPVPLVAGKTVSVAAHNDNANIFVSTRDPGHHGELYSNPAIGYAQLETISPEIRIQNERSVSNTLFYWIGPTPKTRHYLKGSQP